MKIFNLTKSKTPKEEVTCIFKPQSEKAVSLYEVTCYMQPPLASSIEYKVWTVVEF